MFATKLTEKISDPRNGKEHYQSLLRKKNTKSVKQSKVINYFFENPNISDMKLFFTEHPRTLNKLSNTLRQAKKSRF